LSSDSDGSAAPRKSSQPTPVPVKRQDSQSFTSDLPQAGQLPMYASLKPLIKEKSQSELREVSYTLLHSLHQWAYQKIDFAQFQKAVNSYTDAVPLAMQLRVTVDLSKWMMSAVVGMKKFSKQQRHNEKLVEEAASMRPSVITIIVNEILREVKFRFNQINHSVGDILSTMTVDVEERFWSRDSTILMSLFQTTLRVVERLIYLITTVHLLKSVRDAMPPDTEDLLCYEDIIGDEVYQTPDTIQAESKGAMSINNILHNMLSPHCTMDSETIATFVVNFSTYLTPAQFLERIIGCFRRTRATTEVGQHKVLCMRMGNVLKTWVRKRFGDFDQRLQQELYQFISDELVVQSEALARNIADAVQEEAENRIMQQQMVNLVEPQQYRDEDLAKGHHCSLLETASVTDVARQLTLIDTQLFAATECQALLNTAWENPRLAHRAQSVVQQLERLNRVTWWVGMEVLARETAEQRAETMKWFLSLAEELRKLRNYQAMVGVVAGLSQLPVHRLKATKKALGKRASKSLQTLRELMDPSDQHNNYRAEQRKGLNERMVPYIGVWLADLARIDEGNDDYVDGQVNFDKCSMTYAVIAEIQLAKDKLYSFTPQEPLYSQLTNLPELDEDALYDLSVLREPIAKKK